MKISLFLALLACATALPSKKDSASGVRLNPSNPSGEPITADGGSIKTYPSDLTIEDVTEQDKQASGVQTASKEGSKITADGLGTSSQPTGTNGQAAGSSNTLGTVNEPVNAQPVGSSSNTQETVHEPVNAQPAATGSNNHEHREGGNVGEQGQENKNSVPANGQGTTNPETHATGAPQTDGKGVPLTAENLARHNALGKANSAPGKLEGNEIPSSASSVSSEHSIPKTTASLAAINPKTAKIEELHRLAQHRAAQLLEIRKFGTEEQIRIAKKNYETARLAGLNHGRIPTWKGGVIAGVAGLAGLLVGLPVGAAISGSLTPAPAPTYDTSGTAPSQ